MRWLAWKEELRGSGGRLKEARGNSWLPAAGTNGSDELSMACAQVYAAWTAKPFDIRLVIFACRAWYTEEAALVNNSACRKALLLTRSKRRAPVSRPHQRRSTSKGDALALKG